MSVLDKPSTDWASGDGLRAVQLFALAYPDTRSARAVLDAAGLPWSAEDEALPAPALWAVLLRRAVEADRAYDLAAELLHDETRSWFAGPLQDLVGDRLPEVHKSLTVRHGLPLDPDAKAAVVGNLDIAQTSAALVDPVPVEEGALEAITDASAGLRDQDVVIVRELDARRRMAMIRRGGAALGTGFLLGPDLLLTAAHVLSLWVPESRRTSCNLLILVDKPAEAVVSFDLVDLGCCATGEWS